MKNLQELLDTGNYFTDKGRFSSSGKYFDTSKVDLHNYIESYERLFYGLREKKINFLEIGVYQGGSISLWRDYFHKDSLIHGLDIVYTDLARSTLKDKKVSVHLSDSTDSNSKFLRTIEDNTYDIIIDDGNHSFEYQYKTLINYFPKLKIGGIYVIEDVEKRTMNSLKMINQIKKFKDFEIIDLREQDKREDSVLFVFRKGENKENTSRVHFVTFYSQGHPNDNGLDLSETETNVRRAVKPHMDSFTAYHPKDFLEDENLEWCIRDWSKVDKKYSRPKEGWWSPKMNQHVNINNSCDKTGFFAWKAICILEKMKEVPYGDIVYYHDGNFDKKIDFKPSKYPYYVGSEKWKELCNSLLNSVKTDVFIPWEQNSGLQPIRPFCREHCFRKMAEFTDYYTKYDCLWAGIIIMRRSALSEKFLTDVIKSLQDIELVSNIPEDLSNEFQWHTWDQPVWTLMARKYIREGLFPENWPKYHINCRIFSEKYLKVSSHVSNR